MAALWEDLPLEPRQPSILSLGGLNLSIWRFEIWHRMNRQRKDRIVVVMNALEIRPVAAFPSPWRIG